MYALVSMYHDVYEVSPNESGFLGAGADRYKYQFNDFQKHIVAIAKSLKNPPILINDFNSNKNKYPYIITFDDGGVSFYTVIFKILTEMNWKAHFFISTDYIGNKSFLTNEQIIELHKMGHIIGAHSASHPKNISILPF